MYFRPWKVSDTPWVLCVKIMPRANHEHARRFYHRWLLASTTKIWMGGKLLREFTITTFSNLVCMTLLSKCSDVMCHMFFEGHAYPKSEINIVDQCWPEVRPESSLFMFVKRWFWWKFILFRPGYMPVSFELSILLRFPHWKLYFYR